jgi:hypothetical protein
MLFILSIKALSKFKNFDKAIENPKLDPRLKAELAKQTNKQNLKQIFLFLYYENRNLVGHHVSVLLYRKKTIGIGVR